MLYEIINTFCKDKNNKCDAKMIIEMIDNFCKDKKCNFYVIKKPIPGLGCRRIYTDPKYSIYECPEESIKIWMKEK
jgi:hypothetical protein